MLSKIYHKENGEAEMYEVDARAAVQRFPLEWSDKPWPDADAKAAADKAAADAKKPASA